VSPSKTPVAQPVADFNNFIRLGALHVLKMCEPFGWHEVNKSKLDDIRKRLSELEKLTWKEILIDQITGIILSKSATSQKKPASA
jgi:hypothetical protein